MAGAAALLPALANDFPAFAKAICWCWWGGALFAVRQAFGLRLCDAGIARTAALVGLGVGALLVPHACELTWIARGGNLGWIVVFPVRVIVAVAGVVGVRGLWGMWRCSPDPARSVRMGGVGTVGVIAAVILAMIMTWQEVAFAGHARSPTEDRALAFAMVGGAMGASVGVGRLPGHVDRPEQLVRLAVAPVALGLYGAGFAVWGAEGTGEVARVFRGCTGVAGLGFALLLGLGLLVAVALRRVELLEAEERDAVDGPDAA